MSSPISVTGSPMTPDDRPVPPQPSLNADTAFFWEGLQKGRLLIQRCEACGLLRHPPGPSCTRCHSFAWDTQTSTGVGFLVSFVVVHRPRHPAFDYPLAVGLIELEGGVRMVAPLAIDNQLSIEIGMPLRVVIEPIAGEHRLPKFQAISEAKADA